MANTVFNLPLAVTGNAHYLSHTNLYINGNGHKLELRRNRNYLTNHTKSKPCR